MARSSFVSFHYQNDYWRVQQILNMGAIENQPILTAQRWEEVKRKGEKAIQDWINLEMSYKGAVVVLIGTETASRKFVKYEIKRAWSIRKPLLGIRIHGLANVDGYTSNSGPNPFAQFGFSNSTHTYADYVPVFDPNGYGSREKYADIKKNIENWIAKGYKRP